MSPIDPRLQEALDGERDPGELPADLREAHARLIAAAQLVSGTPQLSVGGRRRLKAEGNPGLDRQTGPCRRARNWANSIWGSNPSKAFPGRTGTPSGHLFNSG